jgi:hypothetical protein
LHRRRRPRPSDVHDAEHRVRAVENGSGAENDLDVIDELDGHAEPTIEARGATVRLVHRMSIDEQEDVIA